MHQTFEVIASRAVAVRRPSTGAPPSDHPVIDSRDLLRGQREILIRHGDREYRLRHTRNDKLILPL